MPATTAIDVNVTAELPPLVTVSVCAALVDPSSWMPKSRLEGAIEKIGISVSLATNASEGPSRAVWNAPAETGKEAADE